MDGSCPKIAELPPVETRRLGVSAEILESKSPVPDLLIDQGCVLIYRIFDMGEEINLQLVERILSRESGRSRLRLARGGRQALAMRNPPIRVSLGESPVKVGFSGERGAIVLGTIWDYGVISISLQLEIPRGTPWDQLVRDSSMYLGEAKGSEEFDLLARRKVLELSGLLKPAVRGPRCWNVYEDYVIYFLESVRGITSGKDLLSQARIPELILAESQEELAERSRAGIFEHVYQYASNDLTVIDWNSAIVLEPGGQRDIPDVLEFAVTQLLEFRYYDELLDQRLSELYDEIGKQRNTFWRGIWRGKFARISREANSRYIEFSELIERIDNSLKVVGDFYLATIFRAAARKFRIRDWQDSVVDKMNLLARASELIQGEINATRGHSLELVIILLIAFEIISAIF